MLTRKMSKHVLSLTNGNVDRVPVKETTDLYDASLIVLHFGGEVMNQNIPSAPLEMAVPCPSLHLMLPASQECMKKCLQAGMNDYLVKPIDGDEMVEKITKWINVAELLSSSFYCFICLSGLP